jgi:hypothetical protein
MAYSVLERYDITFFITSSLLAISTKRQLCFFTFMDQLRDIELTLITMFVFDTLKIPSGCGAPAWLRDWVKPHEMKSHNATQNRHQHKILYQ